MFKILGIPLALSLLFALSTPAAMAASYPSKPVRLIVPFAPGGGNDIVGRAIATLLADKLGKQIVVDNRGGAGGIIGTEIAAHSQPDGYTLLQISNAYCFSTAIHSKLPYDPVKSFIPIANMATGPIVLAVYPGLPVKSVKELIALAKEKPGKLILAASGVGGFGHLGSVLFGMMTGIDVITVQFKGGSTTQIDVIGGHSQIVFNGIVSILPFIPTGQLRALGVGAKKRSVLLPDLPTISEAGVPGYEATNFFGIIAPAGTPQAIVGRLNEEIMTILAAPKVQKLFMFQGAEVAYMGPAEFGKFVDAEIVKWTKVVREAGIKSK